MREKGPVEILCKEIGFRFEPSMERDAIYVAFVRKLIEEIADIRITQGSIASIPGVPAKPPSSNSLRVFDAAIAMVDACDRASMIALSENVHKLADNLNPEDTYPTDHLIEMLSSVASAIRFGLETPCHSRHAAAAAGHIWKHKYGLSLFDSFTSDWQKDWTRAQLQSAILALAMRSAKQ